MMLRELLRVAAREGKKIYFRNWSLGVGEVGDMHTNPLTYQRVLGDENSPNLIVSTKYSKGDFYRYLPHNPTLMIGKQKRIIEFQARREFEAFNAFPNYLAPLYQNALQELRKENPNIQGIWLWTQRGGPLRAGPLSIYPFHGFWLFIDANVYATARLAWDPQTDLASLTEAWVCRNFGNDPQTVYRLTQLLHLSPEAILKGLYLSQFARTQVLACSTEPPPTPLIWDIVAGSNSVLSGVYFASKQNLRSSIAEGFEAVKTVERMKILARGLNMQTSKQQYLYDKLLESLDYEENLLETLAWYRKSFLTFYHWLDTGAKKSYQTWKESHAVFQDKKKQHLAKYEENLDFPAYNFFAADLGLAHAQRSVAMLWLARALLIATITMLLCGSDITPDHTPQHSGESAMRQMWFTLIAPWRINLDEQRSFSDYLFLGLSFFLIIGCVLVLSSVLSFTLPLWASSSLIVFSCSLMLLGPKGHDSDLSLLMSISGPLLCSALLFMIVASVRGPLFFWYLFWTSSTFRLLALSITFSFLFWMFAVVFETTRALPTMSAAIAAGNLFVAIGAVFIMNGLFFGLVGLEHCLTVLNNEMAILPPVLSKVLGITTHLNINPNIPYYLAGIGFLLVPVGVIIRVKNLRFFT
jgi:hypothetical protein